MFYIVKGKKQTSLERYVYVGKKLPSYSQLMVGPYRPETLFPEDAADIQPFKGLIG